MTASGDSERPQNDSNAGIEPGVLASLPSTRPQRPSARRAAAKRSTAAKQSATGRARRAADVKQPATGIKANAKRATRTSANRATKTPRPPIEPSVPRQGFEAEGDLAPGASIQPPSGSELAASVAELIGELAQTSLSSGGHLLKEALRRLPGTTGL